MSVAKEFEGLVSTGIEGDTGFKGMVEGAAGPPEPAGPAAAPPAGEPGGEPPSTEGAGGEAAAEPVAPAAGEAPAGEGAEGEAAPEPVELDFPEWWQEPGPPVIAAPAVPAAPTAAAAEVPTFVSAERVVRMGEALYGAPAEGASEEEKAKLLGDSRAAVQELEGFVLEVLEGVGRRVYEQQQQMEQVGQVCQAKARFLWDSFYSASPELTPFQGSEQEARLLVPLADYILLQSGFGGQDGKIDPMKFAGMTPAQAKAMQTAFREQARELLAGQQPKERSLPSAGGSGSTDRGGQAGGGSRSTGTRPAGKPEGAGKTAAPGADGRSAPAGAPPGTGRSRGFVERPAPSVPPNLAAANKEAERKKNAFFAFLRDGVIAE